MIHRLQGRRNVLTLSASYLWSSIAEAHQCSLIIIIVVPVLRFFNLVQTKIL